MKLLAVEARQWGIYLVPRYKQVEQLGFEVYLLTGEGTPDSWPADRFRSLGSKRLPDILAAARAWHAEEHFAGVFSFSEMAVLTAAHVAEALGLPGIGPRAALTSRNKLLMHQAYERAGVPQARFRFVTELGQARAAAEEFGYPVIVKPTLGASSGFVFRADTPAELELRFDQAWAGIGDMLYITLEADEMELGPKGLLVESFLDGHEHLIETTVWDGEVYLGSVVDRVTVEGNTFDDDVHHAPTSLGPADLAKVYDVVTRAVRAQGLERSTAHAEVRFHRGEPHILEIGARPGGGGLDYMARISAGHDPIRAVADVARGIRPDLHHFTPTGVHTAAMAMICPAGVVERIVVPPAVETSPAIAFLKITARPGDLIKRPPDGNTVFGYLGATGSSFDDTLATATGLAEEIEVKLAR